MPRQLFLIIAFFISVSCIKAQAPGNNTLLHQYTIRNFSPYSIVCNQIVYNTDLSKEFVLNAFGTLHNAQFTLFPLTTAAQNKTGSGLLYIRHAVTNQNFLNLSAFHSGELKGELSGTFYKRLQNNRNFTFQINSGFFHHSNQWTAGKKDGFLRSPVRTLGDLQTDFTLNRQINNWNRRFSISFYGLSAASFNGKKHLSKNSYSSGDADEVFSLRQRRTVYATKGSFNLDNYNRRFYFSLSSWYKQYKDSTQNGLQFYRAEQEVLNTILSVEKDIPNFNLFGGFTLLYDKAAETINGIHLNRKFLVPGLQLSSEFSMQRSWKVTGSLNTEYHPQFKWIHQPSIRADYMLHHRWNFGLFSNTGIRTVNVLQENLHLTSGNRSLIVPAIPLQEHMNRSGFMTDLRISEHLNCKVMYQYNHFKKYVYADIRNNGTVLSIHNLNNAFGRHVLESSIIWAGKNDTYFSFKMRNNLFNLQTNSENNILYYTPATDMHLQINLNVYTKTLNEGTNQIDLKFNNYLALGQRVLLKNKEEPGFSWQKKNYNQTDLEISFRRLRNQSWNQKKQRYVQKLSCDIKLGVANLFFQNPDTFISGNSGEYSGTQFWGNYTPARLWTSVVIYFKR